MGQSFGGVWFCPIFSMVTFFTGEKLSVWILFGGFAMFSKFYSDSIPSLTQSSALRMLPDDDGSYM